jgi:cell division protein FtsB
MSNRLVPAILITLLAVVHAQLWFGRGSFNHVQQMQSTLDGLAIQNAKAQLLNDQLTAEVSDLQEGLEIVEEKARFELGMVKPNEIFVQFTK